MADLYGLTEAQVQTLREIFRLHKAGMFTGSALPVADAPMPPVETYLGKTLTELPARVDNTPGAGTARLWGLDPLGTELIDLEIDVDVLNMLAGIIPADSWVPLVREPNSGNYLALSVVPLGCGLTVDDNGNLAVDVGAGLVCDEAGLSVSVGCGLAIDDLDALTVHAAELAGRGLEAGTGCALDALLGCGLMFGASDEIIVDVATIAGTGLIASTAYSACTLNIDYGCGLTIEAGQLVFDRTDVVGKGLVAASGADNCQIDVKIGCGLTYGTADEIRVKAADLAGTGLATEGACGLKVRTGPGIDPGGGALAGSSDVNYFRTACCHLPRWYTSDTGGSPAVSRTAIGPDKMWAIPFVTPAGGAVDALRVICTPAAAHARLAIYKRRGAGGGGINDNRPGARLWQSPASLDLAAGGEIEDDGAGVDVDPAPCADGPGLPLKPGELYWLVVILDDGVDLDAIQAGSIHPVMGRADDAADGYGAAFSAVLPYGVMPLVFPADMAVVAPSVSVPLIEVRFKCADTGGDGTGCEEAIALTVLETGENEDAVGELGAGGAWFSFTAPEDDVYHFTSCSDIAIAQELYLNADCAALEAPDCEASGDVCNCCEVSMAAGDTVYIHLAGPEGEAFVLHAESGGCGADCFSGEAVALHATGEHETADAEAWHHFTAPDNGTYRFAVCVPDQPSDVDWECPDDWPCPGNCRYWSLIDGECVARSLPQLPPLMARSGVGLRVHCSADCEVLGPHTAGEGYGCVCLSCEMTAGQTAVVQVVLGPGGGAYTLQVEEGACEAGTGGPTLSSDCGCCPPIIGCSCTHCETLPVSWALTVAGITNGTCNECPGLNGDFTLTFNEAHDPAETPRMCEWESGGSIQCGLPDAEVFWTLSYDWTSNEWILEAGLSSVVYRKADAEFSCNSSNTFTRTSTTGYCGDWPLTLTITPA